MDREQFDTGNMDAEQNANSSAENDTCSEYAALEAEHPKEQDHVTAPNSETDADETKTGGLEAEISVKENTLENMHKELLDKESRLNNWEIKLKMESDALEHKKNSAEADLNLELSAKRDAAHKELQEELNAARKEFSREKEQHRKDMDEAKKNALANMDAELEAKWRRENARQSERLENEYNLHVQTIKRERDAHDAAIKREREEHDARLSSERDEHFNRINTEQAEHKQKLNADAQKILQDVNEEAKRRKEDVEREEKRLGAIKENLDKRAAELDEKQTELEKAMDDLNKDKLDLERRRRRLEKKQEDIDAAYEDLDNALNERYKETFKSKDIIIDKKQEELNRLRDELAANLRDMEIVSSFKEIYGDEQQIITQKIKNLQESKDELEKKLNDSVDRARYNALEEEKQKLLEDNEDLHKRNTLLAAENNSAQLYESENICLNTRVRELEGVIETLRGQKEDLLRELKRLTTTDAAAQDRDLRIAAINKGVLDIEKCGGTGEANDSRSCYDVGDEIKWLENILDKCDELGIRFNKRILHAFHTALKINEWSIITVLAGVSGTGKSELPKLYSTFGGLNYCATAVQPNWDSQESMLGFFNSIDNRFEPEELLKFLVQCTNDPNHKDYMSLVLLDEMNLAHVEHYFAEFLSKLEMRRGYKKKEVPELEVKLGAGVEPLMLSLQRNILWAGTMNQDETTKSLSDKVLDRGIVINFPRPKKLVSRGEYKSISDVAGANLPRLHRKTWNKWVSLETNYSPEQKKEAERYRRVIEEMNAMLENVGRALGHRVWQSIESYIYNYPTVRKELKFVHRPDIGKNVYMPSNEELNEDLRAAMHTAFEDQIVQKVMPKLRGIETRSKNGMSTLDAIEQLLVNEGFDSLQQDFTFAREHGYGQFIWNSANYLAGNDQ